MKFLDELINLIDVSIHPESDNNITDGGIIAPGYKDDIDKDRMIIANVHEWILQYKETLAQETGIKNLKIKFTHNLGYFIEVSNSYTGEIPNYFIHKQTLAGAMRYITVELTKFQNDLETANTRLFENEYNYFIEIRNSINIQFNNLGSLNRCIELLDFYSCSAYISLENGYCSPDMTNTFDMQVTQGKHPVLSKYMPDFISNDNIFSKRESLQVITGPNMGGKSTFLRQSALLILMSHMGLDIPAKKATIPLTDRIFSRVGSGDNLFLGQSTFMVEMQEIAYILKNASKKSFIIIDEIGRGTSTYDGMSLAWSILHYIYKNLGAKTLFATHYHEIIDYSSSLKGVKNYSVAVGENTENIVFLRKIIPGGIKKSYGIEVAKLAGIPFDVLELAKETMQDLVESNTYTQLSLGNDVYKDQNSYESEKIAMFCETLVGFDIQNMTPVQALNELEKLQKLIKKTK